MKQAPLLKEADVRLCRIHLWCNFQGLGFRSKRSSSPPHIISMVESNSPAAASGLKICDAILAINDVDMSQENHDNVCQAIQAAVNHTSAVEILVVEEKYYKSLKEKNISIDFKLVNVIIGPTEMPAEFVSFPKLTPRICKLYLGQNDREFGFEIVDDEKCPGVFIQTISLNSPASYGGLRKNDRIIEINGRKVNENCHKDIIKKIDKANKKGRIELFVADTHTYEHYMRHNLPLSSSESSNTRFVPDSKMNQPSKRMLGQTLSQWGSLLTCSQYYPYIQ